MKPQTLSYMLRTGLFLSENLHGCTYNLSKRNSTFFLQVLSGTQAEIYRSCGSLLQLGNAEQANLVAGYSADVAWEHGALGLAFERWGENLIRNLLMYKVLFRIL